MRPHPDAGKTPQLFLFLCTNHLADTRPACRRPSRPVRVDQGHRGLRADGSFTPVAPGACYRADGVVVNFPARVADWRSRNKPMEATSHNASDSSDISGLNRSRRLSSLQLRLYPSLPPALCLSIHPPFPPFSPNSRLPDLLCPQTPADLSSLPCSFPPFADSLCRRFLASLNIHQVAFQPA